MGVAIFEERKETTDPQRRDYLLEQSSYYINRALDIYPAYGSALTMKSGVIAEEYKKDNDIDKLLAGFESILEYRTVVDFINQYLEYLIRNNRNPKKIFDFLYRIGYNRYYQNGNYQVAVIYLNYAHQVEPGNQTVIEALAESYRQLGNAAKASEFQQKLR